MLPLSIGDGELCDTALTTVSVPEFFRYWLQGGRISIGFLGAAQIDRFGNLNTTVIGPYERPSVRLPGAGGAPDMAVCCREVFVVMRALPGAHWSSGSTSSPRSATAMARDTARGSG